MTSRVPANPFKRVLWGEILGSTLMAQERIRTADPEEQWGLGLARVMEIDYEGMTCVLRVVIGAAGDDDRAPIPLTFPGAGNRHFFGALPQIGDLAVVGWMPQESLKPKTRTPVILGWALPGVYAGRNWLTTSTFGDAELDQTSQRQRDVLGASFPLIRHKLRAMSPGNIVASSAQGSDLILDEGVSLINRRGNEIRIRDQDQAVVTRALQRFDALAGVRSYTGMVQRDATFLPPTMLGDGKDWAGGQQTIDGSPLAEGDLPDDETQAAGFLTPARVLGKYLNEDGNLDTGLFTFADHIDPFMFLRLGGFIDEQGFVTSDKVNSDAIYGGKSIFRVAAGRDVNAVLSSSVPTFTEHRIEITHTTDGRLPVTEQTEGFDAERLPLADPDTPGGHPNAPFIEFVMGSVVGNDPYTDKGRQAYGLPLVPKVFSDGVASPRLDPAPLAVSDNTDSSPTPMGLHAASLFKLSPINGDLPTWWSVNKQGQFLAAISGPRNEDSVELSLTGGLTLGIGGRLNLIMNGGISLGTKSKQSLHLKSDEGPVTIYGGGPLRGAEGAAKGNGAGESSDLPSVDIFAQTNARIRANRKVLLKGQTIETRSKKVVMSNVANFDVDAADGKISFKAQTVDMIVSGKRVDQFSGPKNFLPTSGALHERTYTPAYPGVVCEEVNYTWGDREETFLLGSHTTSILIGNATYQTALGTVTLRALGSSLSVGVASIDATVPVGTISLTAHAGTATMSALAGVMMESTAGLAVVKGGLGVILQGPIYGPDAGPIIASGSLEPFTYLPYATWGAGARGHIISP